MARKAPLSSRPKGARYKAAKLGMSITGGGEDESGPPAGSAEFGEQAKRRRRKIMKMKEGSEPDPALVNRLRKDLRRA